MIAMTTAQPARHPSPTVKARSLAYLIFERPDLAAVETYLADFGLSVAARTPGALYFRGTTGAPFCYVVRERPKARFAGFGVTVGSREDLAKLSALPEASAIAAAATPFGGELVRLKDPSGFVVEAVFGQTESAPLPSRAALPANTSGRNVRINAGQRAPVRPPEVLRLGHVVIEVARYQATLGWYTRHLGMIPSDVQLLPDGEPIMAFLRLDLGDEPADHHTIGIAQGFAPAYNHSAYEVVDADAVGMGNRVLKEKKYKHAWGVGRHLLGSQIFDYWQDPWGDKHEHYCDGDVFTADSPTGFHAAAREGMAQWGQAMPADFTKPKMTPKAVLTLIRNLIVTPDLTPAKLAALAKIFG